MLIRKYIRESDTVIAEYFCYLSFLDILIIFLQFLLCNSFEFSDAYNLMLPMFFVDTITATEEITFAFRVQANHHDMLFKVAILMARPVQRIERSIIHQICMYITIIKEINKIAYYENHEQLGHLRLCIA